MRDIKLKFSKSISMNTEVLNTPYKKDGQVKDKNRTVIIHGKEAKKLPEEKLLYLINVKKSEEAKEELIRRIHRRLNKKVKQKKAEKYRYKTLTEN